MAAARLLELLALAAKLLAHLLPKDRQRLLVVGDPRHDEVLLLDHRSGLLQLRDVGEQRRWVEGSYYLDIMYYEVNTAAPSRITACSAC